MHNETFNIDKGPPGTAGNVREFFSRNQVSGTVKTWHKRMSAISAGVAFMPTCT